MVSPTYIKGTELYVRWSQLTPAVPAGDRTLSELLSCLTCYTKMWLWIFFYFFLCCLFAEEIKLTHLEGHVSLQGLCVAKSSWLWSISKTLCCPAVLLISELVTHSWILLEACGLWQTNNTVWIKQAFNSLHHHYFCITRMLWRQNPQVSDPQMPDPALELKCWP